MNNIRLAKKVDSDAVFKGVTERFRVSIPEDICEFLKNNSRGIPTVKTLPINGKEYLLSEFLSVDENDRPNMLTVALMLEDMIGEGVFLPFAADGFGSYYGFTVDEGSIKSIALYSAEDGKISHVCDQFIEILQALDLE